MSPSTWGPGSPIIVSMVAIAIQTLALLSTLLLGGAFFASFGGDQ